jgi:hypothetical protein
MGEVRGQRNDEVAQESIVEEVVGDRTLAETYWAFYDSTGDMNIFDTFIAARQAEPRFYPYAWSWIYVPLHLVPRAFWPGKPKRGITIDGRFTRGAPYSPGIAGFFLMDGGLLWMLLSMLVLGVLISSLDWYVLTLPRGYLRCAMVGIVAVNAMFLSRFFLWQYFWQMMYAVIPIAALAWFFRRQQRRSRSSATPMTHTSEHRQRTLQRPMHT